MEPSNKCANCGAVMVESLDGTLTCTHCGSVLHPGQGTQPAVTPVYTPIPRDVALASGRKRQAWRPYVWGFFIWVMLVVPRALLYKNLGDDFSIKSTVYDNLLISPVGGIFWILRGTLLVIVIPTVINLLRGKER